MPHPCEDTDLVSHTSNRSNRPSTDLSNTDSDPLVIPTLPSINQGTLAIGKPKSPVRKLLTETIMEVVLLIGNVMFQRGIWDFLDNKEIPAYVSGFAGLVLFAWTACLNNVFNLSKEQNSIFAPRRHVIGGLLLLCSINVWRFIWNLQSENGVSVECSALVGSLIIMVGTMLEQYTLHTTTLKNTEPQEAEQHKAADLLIKIRNR